MVVSTAVTILILKSATVVLGDSEELGLQPAPRPVEEALAVVVLPLVQLPPQED